MMIKLKKYSTYKNSGVEWLGDIPEGWESLKIKNICVFDKGFGLSKNDITKDGKNECILYGELFTIFKNQNSILKPQSRTNLTIGKTSFGNEVLIPSSTTTSGIDLANAKFIEKKGVLLGGDIIILKSRNNNKYLPKFLSYFLTYASKTEFIKYSKGVTIVHIYAKTIREMPIFLPTIDEQKNIIIYLDKKVQLTDKAIKQKEQLIKLLKERRQILINDAVTKGIDKTVSMKNSGVEWIGEIPEGWEVKKVKNIFDLIIDPAPNNNDEELLSIYTDIGVKPRKELAEKGNKASTTDGYWRVRKGDFIVNKLLAWMGAIGLSNYNGVTSPAYDILRAKIDVTGVYYHELFRLKIFSQEMKKYSRGIMDMRLRLYFDKFGDIRVPYPSKQEQQKIVDFIEEKTSKIDKAIDLQQQQITKLKEYKITLIDSAVTGKVIVS
jgi:type I restriction enzyme S subunit